LRGTIYVSSLHDLNIGLYIGLYNHVTIFWLGNEVNLKKDYGSTDTPLAEKDQEI